MRPRAEDIEPPAGFRGLRPVGWGDRGTVYVAEQIEPPRPVALKIRHLPVDKQSQHRFDQVCEIAARLGAHPRLVTIYGHGRTEAGRPYVAMRYLPDGSLADLLARRGPLPVDEVLGIGVQVAEALDEVHRAGTVHGGVTPSNILISPEGAVLGDVGMGALRADLDAAPQIPTLAAGYIAPEVLRSRSFTGPASDVYALAASLYHLLAGVPPFAAGPGGEPEPLRRIENDPPPDIARADVPLRLTSVLFRALAKEPADRFAGAADFARSLQQIRIDHLTASAGSPRVPAGLPPPPPPDRPAAPPVYRLPEVTVTWAGSADNAASVPTRRRKAGRRTGIVGLLAVAVVLAVAMPLGLAAFAVGGPTAATVAWHAAPSSTPAPAPVAPNGSGGAAPSPAAPSGPDSAAPAPSSPAATPGPRLTISKGAPTSQSNCPAPCNFVTVSLRGFRPTTDYATTCWTDSPTAHAFFTFTARTDGAGNYDAPRSLCWFGQPGRQVWLTVGGVTSNVLTW